MSLCANQMHGIESNTFGVADFDIILVNRFAIRAQTASLRQLFDFDLREARDSLLVPDVGEHLFDVGAAPVVLVRNAEFKIHERFFFNFQFFEFVNSLLLLQRLLLGLRERGILGVPVPAAPLAALVEEADLGGSAEVALPVFVAHELDIVPLELVVAASDATSALVMH